MWWWPAIGLGLVTGLGHAFEPDHLAAVSTIVAERPGPRNAARVGLLWGLGHAGMLFVTGSILIAARVTLSEPLRGKLELLVALMLIALGIRSLLRSVKPKESTSHDHIRRPLLVGSLHGLAGSGALTAIALSRVSASPSLACVYIACFGMAATVGMAAMAGMMGFPLSRVARSREGAGWLLRVSGTASLVIGGWWAVTALT